MYKKRLWPTNRTEDSKAWTYVSLILIPGHDVPHVGQTSRWELGRRSEQHRPISPRVLGSWLLRSRDQSRHWHPGGECIRSQRGKRCVPAHSPHVAQLRGQCQVINDVDRFIPYYCVITVFYIILSHFFRYIMFDDHHVECRSNVSIEAGEEITDFYVSTLNGTNHRRTSLRDGWYFECKCNRCTGKYSSISSSNLNLSTR